MKKIKKIIILAMATTMLLGATLTVNAAGCMHSPQAHSSSSTYGCKSHTNCTITISHLCGKCIYCGQEFSVKESVSHSNN